MTKALERVGELPDRIVAHAQASHPRINLDVNIRDGVRRTGRAVHRLGHIQAIDDRREFVAQARLGLSLPESAEAEDGPLYPCLAQLSSLFGQRDAEPLRAFGREPARASHGPVPVSVRLDDRHHGDAWSNPVAYEVKV